MIRLRHRFVAGAVWAAFHVVCHAALAHQGALHLDCQPAFGETCYRAHLHGNHSAHPPHPQAVGEAVLVLNRARNELRYELSLSGLDLEADPIKRTDPNDILGIHIHLIVPGTVGPHVLNIFGLATFGVPAEEDADLVVDYEHDSLRGRYDISDATIDPATGLPYLQFFPLTSKIIDDWVDELDAGQLMFAVHSVASGFPNMAVHGPIVQSVPEPSLAWLSIASLLSAAQTARRWQKSRWR